MLKHLEYKNQWHEHKKTNQNEKTIRKAKKKIKLITTWSDNDLLLIMTLMIMAMDIIILLKIIALKVMTVNYVKMKKFHWSKRKKNKLAEQKNIPKINNNKTDITHYIKGKLPKEKNGQFKVMLLLS